MAQVVEHPPGKCKALNSNPITANIYINYIYIINLKGIE
jgi:hypothetical protein